MRACALNGQIGLIGVLTGTDGEVNPLPCVFERLTIHGIYVGSREMFADLDGYLTAHASARHRPRLPVRRGRRRLRPPRKRRPLRQSRGEDRGLNGIAGLTPTGAGPAARPAPAPVVAWSRRGARRRGCGPPRPPPGTSPSDARRAVDRPGATVPPRSDRPAGRRRSAPPRPGRRPAPNPSLLR